MTGLAFERATADAFRHLGWEVEQTRASGDYGADVIARFGTTSIVIQCKDWKGPAGLAAVQEVFFARKHYRANLAMVVARSGFTRQAQKAAESTEVRLVRLSDLRRHCEFDRSVEAARAQREREARETARRDRELAEARERLAREEAETRERLAREEAKARERHAQKVREAKENEAAAARARAAANEERRSLEARAAWLRYADAVDLFERKNTVYAHRWVALLLPTILATLFVANKAPRPEAGVILLLVGLGAGLFWFLFVASEPGTYPVRPSMPRPTDVPDPHAGKIGQRASPKDSTARQNSRLPEGHGRVVRWCSSCSTGLNLPMGKEGTVRCKCGAAFWART
ncbi:hypothetical protein GCM10011504_33960 [Siccirubricoccus deserti]|uniref:Restriction endonuclease n=1 Tax=Siccirubricoccus deserti TaxID=2013562 RepID=A0A9X0UEN5_9PROT|nr:restriction endonuclease [Siccirubricoccus deserti]MBC4018084.1 restriction endonuclease [Siccirubricoccus deserti]GGC52790.1 hypothetical protein GCM10011504_33960 [Siccirubricoccus deserti]